MSVRNVWDDVKYRVYDATHRRGKVVDGRYVMQDRPNLKPKPWGEECDELAASVPERLKYDATEREFGGFDSQAEHDDYWETELKGIKKGPMDNWTHWTPLMAIDRTDREQE